MKPPVQHTYQPRCQHRSPRHPRVPQVLTVMLTGVTLIALLALGSLFVAPQSLVAEDRSLDLVPRFYAGANEILAGGSPSALEDVVATDLLDHQPGMPSGDRAALVRRLTDLRLAAPGVQLRVSAIVEDDEWAAARVTAVGLHPAVHGVALDLALEPLAQTEFFRIGDGRIVAYWPGGTAIDVPRALPPIAVSPWMTETAISLARLTFPSGAALRDLESPGEHLLLLESGELGIGLVGSASLLEAARPEAGWQATPASGQELVLRAGDAVLIRPGTRHAITNRHAGAATLLGVAMVPAAALDAQVRQKDVGEARLIAIYDPARVDTGAPGDRHVHGTVLATGVGAARSGPCAAVARTQLRVTRFTLGPGEGLPAHPVAGIELLALDSGGLEIGTPPWERGRAATPAATPAMLSAPPWSNPSWRGGAGLVVAPPAAPPVRNTGPHPLRFIAVALQPAGGASCAVSPVDT